VGISLLKVAIVYGAAQGLEAAVISPRIVGESVGLHPVWVLLALALGGAFAGFVGLLIAVPAAVGIKLLVERGQARYRASRLFVGAGGTGP
jgi:predicted PurR-regulated permease PerM